MKKIKEFDFSKARRITKVELEEGRKAIEELTGKKRPIRKGRPPKADKYIPISIRIDPEIFAKIQKTAKKIGMPYQSLINMILKQNFSPNP